MAEPQIDIKENDIFKLSPELLNISQLIVNANEDDLRDIVSGWIDKHSDFRDYVRNILCPPIEDVDFGRKLSHAVNRETKEFFSRHDVREATDWGNVYNDLIEPWSENADSLSERGYAKTQKEIVEFLLDEYRFRPSLTKELKSIKLVIDNEQEVDTVFQ